MFSLILFCSGFASSSIVSSCRSSGFSIADTMMLFASQFGFRIFLPTGSSFSFFFIVSCSVHVLLIWLVCRAVFFLLFGVFFVFLELFSSCGLPLFFPLFSPPQLILVFAILQRLSFSSELLSSISCLLLSTWRFLFWRRFFFFWLFASSNFLRLPLFLRQSHFSFFRHDSDGVSRVVYHSCFIIFEGFLELSSAASLSHQNSLIYIRAGI